MAATLGVMGPPKKRNTAKELEIQRTEEGDIVFPIEIDKSTRVLALGTIKPRPGFQSLIYIFPVGYPSLPPLRLHFLSSLIDINSECDVDIRVRRTTPRLWIQARR